MSKQKSLNNKGFSLVELIIVIAIMAILIGVMAPNLLRYVERTNVSADVQLADSIRTAVQTALMDSAVVNADITTFTSGHNTSGGAQIGDDFTGTFLTSVSETLGVDAADGDELHAALIALIRSSNDNPTILVEVSDLSAVTVTITGVDNTGGRDTDSGRNIVVPAAVASPAPTST